MQFMLMSCVTVLLFWAKNYNPELMSYYLQLY
jgi:hypothetical protein